MAAQIDLAEAVELARTDICQAPSGKVSLYTKGDGIVHIHAQDDFTKEDMDEVRPVIDALMDGRPYSTTEEQDEDVIHFILMPV
jgi:hypothetical protein